MRLVDRGGFYVAENATVLGGVVCSRGVSIWYGSVLRADIGGITIGEFTNIQDLCALHCDPGKDLGIAPYVTIGHHAMVHAERIGEATLVGIGSLLLGGCRIGEGCIIGAGALVRENQEIPPRSIVLGIPGRVVGQTTDAQVSENRQRAERYFELAQCHARGDVPTLFT
jgi:carbonic anhydrase/acetyltransferase-like protein (isoleucine patch superfamily)